MNNTIDKNVKTDIVKLHNSPSTSVQIRYPSALMPENIIIQGELANKLLLNFSRLEGEYWRPETVFEGTVPGWPGDHVGRTVLALVKLARVTKREPAYLDAIMNMWTKKTNVKGYFGPVISDGVVDEQQMGCHGWVLRGLLEYYHWKQSSFALDAAAKIVENLLLPACVNYSKYPIKPADRLKSNLWKLSFSFDTSNIEKLLCADFKYVMGECASDTGCAFIMLDGAVQAYEVFRTKALRDIIHVMIKRFMEIDFQLLKAQTHATLTGLRGILRFHKIENNSSYLIFVSKMFDLYKRNAWTETYANYNWFGIPALTEPCAVVDSFMLAIELWRNTDDWRYIEDANHIYYNALSVGQRTNGGFGCDNCVGAVGPTIRPILEEAYWCCSMRGSEGLSTVATSHFFHNGNMLSLPFYGNIEVTIGLDDGNVHLVEETQYPNSGNVKLNIIKSNCESIKTLRFYLPSWASHKDIVLIRNGQVVPFSVAKNMLMARMVLNSHDIIELRFTCGLHKMSMLNESHPAGYQTIRHGPMILGCEEGTICTSTELDHCVHITDGKYEISGNKGYLEPLYLTGVGTKEKGRTILFKSI